ncbi:hypothetical protein [Chamaesiphon sp.]|uniref:hypothetical protein n=1 Tax=Chamaesiphon sp. TaxID=2814140 RepID=UPI0035939C55
MNRHIHLSLYLLAMVVMTACGKNSQPPTVVVTPPHTPIVTPPISSPVTVQPPLPTPSPPPLTPTVKPTPSSAPTLSALPPALYPVPTPVAIPTLPPAKTKANPKPDPFSKLKPPTDPEQQITPVGIGSARIGMTFQELKAQLGEGFEFPVKTNFIVDFDAIAVTKAGAVQYYIPYPAGTNFTDTDRIQHLMTDNPNFRTAQGVGPGTPIGQAVTVYGGATLSMSKDNESREFINFTQHPNGLAFRPKPVGSRNFAGEYPESNEEYLKTSKYDRRAAIGQITVSCPEDKCEPSQ